MRNLKKFLALVMAMVMALSLMVSANAATANVVYTDSASVTPEFAEAVDVLSGMGVFHGDEDGFRPGSTITRGEVAAIVYRLATGDVNDVRSGLYKTYAPFTDVNENDWFAGYVGYLWNAGFIKGTTATTYNPYDNVTGYEALAMILRAVGYDKNHEFEGGQWIVNVGSYATQLGILRDVKTTHFADTLHLGARRDVVASLLFNTAAYVPEVTYTALAGYNQYKNIVNVEYNDTLGERLFGLASDRGIVVGNQATGEKYTKIGFSRGFNLNDYEAKILDGKDTICNYANKPGYNAYLYEDYGYSYNDANGDPQWASYNNATNSFIWDTDLKLFGHQVKVWYDDRNTVNSNNQSIFTTYAMYDEVAKAQVVKAGDADLTATTDTKVNNLYSLGYQADKAGFEVKGKNNGAYFNYAFARNKTSRSLPATGNFAMVNTATEDYSANFTSPIQTEELNSPIDVKDAPYYLLISNSTEKENSVDLVISLDLTVTQISQQNDVQKPLSIGLNVGDDTDGYNYFIGAGEVDYEYKNVGGARDYGKRLNVAQENLVLNSAKTLGDQVVAIEITGTTGTKMGDNTSSQNKGNAEAIIDVQNKESSDYYYQTIKLTKQVTGTVVRVDTDTHEVWFNDGTKLERSWLAETVADNRLMDLGTTETENREENIKRTIEVDDFGEYTFTLDDEGKYIFWSTEKSSKTFVYGTYIDYTTPVASSTFTYPLVYVGIDGKPGQANITKVTTDDPDSYVDKALDGGENMGNKAYDEIALPKRDKYDTNLGTTSMGADVYNGRYIGYTMDDKGRLTMINNVDNVTNEVKQGGIYTNSYNGDTANYFALAPVDDAEGSIEIDSTTVNIGAVLAGRGSTNPSDALYLDNNTVFYLVSGAGTDNQKVETYKGLGELLKGNSKVVIHGEKTVADLYAAGTGFHDDADDVWPLTDDAENNTAVNATMIYWKQSSFHYAQDYATTAYRADVVILPKQIVEFQGSTSTSLRFVGKGNSTLEDSANNATRFTMYDVNGNEEQVWVRGLVDGTKPMANYADAIIELSNSVGTYAANNDAIGNFFVNIVPTTDTAKDGGIIYELAKVSSAKSSLIGWYLDSIDVKAGTATLANTNDDPTTTLDYTYIATTYSDQLATIGINRVNIWNVAGAKVFNLNTKDWPGITDLSTLNQASTLETNFGIQVSCFLSKDNSKQASVIFVNYEK